MGRGSGLDANPTSEPGTFAGQRAWRSPSLRTRAPARGSPTPLVYRTRFRERNRGRARLRPSADRVRLDVHAGQRARRGAGCSPSGARRTTASRRCSRCLTRRCIGPGRAVENDRRPGSVAVALRLPRGCWRRGSPLSRANSADRAESSRTAASCASQRRFQCKVNSSTASSTVARPISVCLSINALS